MKAISFTLLTLLAVRPLAAKDPVSKEDITAAAARLEATSGYSWRTTIVVPDDAPMKPGPTEGRILKDGAMQLTLNFGEASMQAIRKGAKWAVTDPQGEWKSLDEVSGAQGPGQFVGAILNNIKPPAKEAAELAGYASVLKKDGGALGGPLSREGATAMQLFKLPGAPAPEIKAAQGSVKFWVQDGALTKYEFKLKGTVSFGGNEFPNERTTTVELKNVGATKLDLPEMAKKKLE